MGLALLSVAAAAYAASDRSVENDRVTIPEKKTVRTITLSPVELRPTREFSGFVRGVRQADVAPKISGSVVHLLKEAGENVRGGEVIAEIDGTELSAIQESTLHSLRATDTAIKTTKKYYDQKVDEAESVLDHASGSSETDAAEEALRSAKKLRDAELASLSTQKAALEGSLMVSHASISNTLIRAPFAGIVTEKKVSLGTFVSSGTSLYTIASPDALEVTVSLPRSVARELSTGTTVRVFPGNASDAIDAKISSIASAVGEATQASVARIRFPSTDETETLRLGEHVRVVFPSQASRTALVVPEASILRIYDDAFVAVVENHRVKKVKVSLGENMDGQREIVSGLETGVHVIVEGQYSAGDNQEVEETYAAR